MCLTGGPEEQWRLFAETGSIWYYLGYKTQQRLTNALGEDGYAADSNDGACPASDPCGGGRSDPDASDP